MGLFDKMLDKIFARRDDALGKVLQAGTQSEGSSTPTGGSASYVAPAAASPAPAAAPMSDVDVEAVLDGMAGKNSQKLNWKTSIVDLMKLLDLDSSLQSRKELADELKYTGDKNDSAAMNVWLHRQVMTKLAANGGKVPADLRD